MCTTRQAMERDFNSLWNTGYFDDLRIEREESPKGWIVHVYVKEKPTIREIKYIGLNAVSQSDVLDKFKELKVGLSQESQFDPTRVKRAEVVLKELLARTRPPVCDHHHGDPADSAGGRRHHLQRERRPEGEGRGDQV